MWRQLPPVTKNLLIINVLIWGAMALVPPLGRSLERLFALYYVESPGFRAWQLVSYMFLHANITHLFFNMFALFMFGSIIEWTMGSKRFLVYYLSCGIGAALIQEGVVAVMLAKYHGMLDAATFSQVINEGWVLRQSMLTFSDPTLASVAMLANTATLGASGAIYGVLLAFGMLYPNREMYLMFVPVPIKAKWMVLGYGAIELLLGVGATGDGVAHWAHLGGMVFGFGLLWYWKKKGVFRGWY